MLNIFDRTIGEGHWTLRSLLLDKLGVEETEKFIEVATAEILYFAMDVMHSKSLQDEVWGEVEKKNL